MSLTRKVAYNFSVQMVGKFINVIIGLANVAIIVRYLGVAGYGDYTTAFAFMTFFSAISDFGFFWVIVRRITAGQDEATIVKNVTSIRLIFSSIVFVSSLILLAFLPYSPQLKTVVMLGALSILWSSQTSVYTALFQSKLKMDLASISEVAARIVAMGLIILAVKMNLGLVYVMAASIFGTFLNFLISFIFSLKFVKPRFGLDWQFAKKFMIEALPIGIISILGLIYFKTDTLILSVFKTSTDVGIYGTPYKILEILMATPLMFFGSVFPALTSAFEQKDNSKITTLFQKSFDLLSIGAFAVVSITLALAKPITNIIAGDEYLNASTINFAGRAISADVVLQILIFAVGLSFLNALFTNSVVIFGRQKNLILPYCLATIFNLSANFILIPKFSYLAAALNTVVTEIIILVACYMIMRKELPVRLNFSGFFKGFIIAIIVNFVLYFVKSFSIFMTIPLGIIMFILGLYCLKVIDKSTLKSLLKD